MKVRFEGNRTSTIIVMYSLYLYYLGLSLRNTSKALVISCMKLKERCYCDTLSSNNYQIRVYSIVLFI